MRICPKAIAMKGESDAKEDVYTGTTVRDYLRFWTVSGV